MERVNKIIYHPKYKEYLTRIEECEKNRIFCKHDMKHFLDVCRIAEIIWLKECGEEPIYVSTQIIYATGLLHDIGRWQEYESGVRHELASATLALPILEECGFSSEETKEILLAIKNHRNKSIKDSFSLSGIIYQADKLSRPCFSCKAESVCDWDLAKKNLTIQW